MPRFDPINDIENSRLILDRGDWPNFHDAEVHFLNIWRGDVRPEDNVWIGPVIEAAFELCALEHPYIAVIKFHDCDVIKLQEFNHQNAVYDLSFSFEARGYLNNGEPMPPWIVVQFEQAFGLRLSFKCMKIQVLKRIETPAIVRSDGN